MLAVRIHIIDVGDLVSVIVRVSYDNTRRSAQELDVAVAIADKPVGVDIECLDRDFDRVAPRYMTEGELALSQDARWACFVWCAKEAIYKLYGQREVDLTEDIRIMAFDAERMQLNASVRERADIVVEAQIIENSVVVSVATYK